MTTDKPMVVINYPLDVIEIRQLKAIFRQVNASKQAIKTLRLSQKNLNNLFNYFLNRYFEIATHIVFARNELAIQISLQLPKKSLGNYLNISFKLNYQDNRLFKFHSLQIGQLLIADEFSQFFLQRVPNYGSFNEPYTLVKKAVKRIKVTPDYLTLAYYFESSANEGSPTSLLTENKRALRFYQHQIDLIIEKHDPAWRLSLAQLLQPLFKIAYQRSSLDTAIDENKWVIMAVSRYVNQSEIQRYLPFNKLNHKLQYATFLYKRMDMAKHFMASALLTAVGNSTLAVLLGEKKRIKGC
ncbi:MAG: hypothetical protein Q9M50_15005 [Methylococcales bacterium]|nr:hypothetical protein [Methylococcales bacterium]